MVFKHSGGDLLWGQQRLPRSQFEALHLLCIEQAIAHAEDGHQDWALRALLMAAEIRKALREHAEWARAGGRTWA